MDKKCNKLIGIKFGTKKVHNLVHLVHLATRYGGDLDYNTYPFLL